LLKNFLQTFLPAILLLSLLAQPALAQPEDTGAPDLPSAASDLLAEAPPEMDFLPANPAPRHGLDILRMAGMFIVVLGLLFITLKIIGRFSRFRSGKQNSIFTMRGILPLDNHKYLAAVEVEGRLLIVGVAQDKINPIANWPMAQDDGFAFHITEDESLPDIIINETGAGVPE
jgi:flagellar biogenesis protein FliO